jgi:hypothetical protein
MKCKFCEREAQIVLAPRSHLGRTRRMIKLAEPLCLDPECLGPTGTGPSPRYHQGRRTLQSTQTYADIMLDFIHSEWNAKGHSDFVWTWYTAKVWQLWLAATGVRGSLRHAPENHSSLDP